MFNRNDLEAGERLRLFMLAVIVGALTGLGGGIPGFGIVILFAVLAIAWIGFGGGLSGIRSLPWPAATAILLIPAIPLLQMIPLPPAIWHDLPGQELRYRSLALVNAGDTWQPVTLTPLYTSYSVIMAIVFCCLVDGLVRASDQALRFVIWLVLGLLGVGIVIGLVQVASGGAVLRLHHIASHGAMLGFLANKNHMALALAASLPLMAVSMQGVKRVDVARMSLAIWALVIAAAIVTTNSRAGVALGFVALAVVAARTIRFRHPAAAAGIVIASVVAGAAIVNSGAFAALFSRVATADEDLRWQFLKTSWPLIARYYELGSGGGSFSTIYQVNEQLAWVKPTYVNQLHNDYAQLLFEYGIGGVLALLMLAGVVIVTGGQRWRAGSPRVKRRVEFGALILLLFAAHSIVDYPLRRPAMLPLFALGLVLATRPSSTSPGRAVPERDA